MYISFIHVCTVSRCAIYGPITRTCIALLRVHMYMYSHVASFTGHFFAGEENLVHLEITDHGVNMSEPGKNPEMWTPAWAQKCSH